MLLGGAPMSPAFFIRHRSSSGGRLLGAARVKIDVPNIQRSVTMKDAFVTDHHGVVVIAGDPSWLLKAVPGASVFAMPADERVLAYKRARHRRSAAERDPDRAFPVPARARRHARGDGGNVTCGRRG